MRGTALGSVPPTTSVRSTMRAGRVSCRGDGGGVGERKNRLLEETRERTDEFSELMYAFFFTPAAQCHCLARVEQD